MAAGAPCDPHRPRERPPSRITNAPCDTEEIVLRTSTDRALPLAIIDPDCPRRIRSLNHLGRLLPHGGRTFPHRQRNGVVRQREPILTGSNIRRLARVAMALRPLVQRSALPLTRQRRRRGHRHPLFNAGTTWRTSHAARSGNLPFLALACITVFLWARRWFGGECGILGRPVIREPSSGSRKRRPRDARYGMRRDRNDGPLRVHALPRKSHA